ncbi:hypothetical protein VHEMI10262 [[Torrubiella] hemipterigena]|nr:hypothetical protein VHEMI10262 [[Torrubiella] hemipterigena]
MLIRTAFKVLTPRDLQFILPTTRQRYDSFIKKQQRQLRNTKYEQLAIHDVEVLPTEKPSSLLWLGNRKTADKVVLFLHGGGFIIPTSSHHIPWAWDCYVKAPFEAGYNVACAAFQYTLSPEAKYPGQLEQTVVALKHIFSQGFKPSDVIIGGDSAGANLSIQLMLLLYRGNEFLPDWKLDEPLLGIFQVSTVLSMIEDNFPSCRTNTASDMIAPNLVHTFMLDLLTPEHYIEYKDGRTTDGLPLDAGFEDCRDLDSVVSNMYINYGEYEYAASHSVELARLLAINSPRMNVTVREDPKGPHDAILLEYMVHGKPGPSAKAMKEWTQSLWKAS